MTLLIRSASSRLELRESLSETERVAAGATEIKLKCQAIVRFELANFEYLNAPDHSQRPSYACSLGPPCDWTCAWFLDSGSRSSLPTSSSQTESGEGYGFNGN